MCSVWEHIHEIRIPVPGERTANSADVFRSGTHPSSTPAFDRSWLERNPQPLPMAIKSYVEQLESVQAAIAAIEGSPNAAYSLLGRTFTKHDLSTLYEREERLR